MLAYQRPEAAGMPVRLAPRPVFLAGREALLAELDGRLGAGSGPRLAVLCGLGGAGKTSVAVEYAHRHLAEVGVCWQFAAEDLAVLEAEFAVLAAQLGAREIVDARDPVASVHAALARAGAGWLLIFDNAVDQASVERFLPPAGNGRLLVTTQSQHWLPSQALDVPVLEPEVAADFLVNRTTDPDRAAALELAIVLGGLPLAMEQAAAYMQATGTRLAAYLSLFRERQADLLARGEIQGHRADLVATLGLALSRLAVEGPPAAALLGLLAFLAPEPVPLAALLGSEQVVSLFGSERVVSLLGPETVGITPLLGDPVAMGDAITSLRRYSLVTLVGDGLVLVHRLVQVITRGQLSAEAAWEWEFVAGAVIELAMPKDPRLPELWPAYAVLLPHARAALGPTSGGMRLIAEYLGASGSYRAARALFQLIIEALAEADKYGPEHPETLTARHSLAYWTGESGEAAGARDQYSTLVPVRERVQGLEHPDTLAAHHELARWTGAAGDAAGARDQLAALLPVEERCLGPESATTLTTRHELARWTGAAGDIAKAVEQLAILVPLREQVHGSEHPETLATRYELAAWTGQMGDAVGARDQLAALLPIEERVLGTGHPSTLITRGDLAHWTGMAEGDAAKPRRQLAALVPLCERVLGTEHPYTLTTRLNVASWALQAGATTRAHAELVELLPVLERALGTEHPNTLLAQLSLGTLAEEAADIGQEGDPAKARDRLAALVALYERALGPEHHQTLATRNSLAHLTGQAGDAAGARDQFAALLPAVERVLGAEHPLTLTARHNLACWTGEAGDPAAVCRT